MTFEAIVPQVNDSDRYAVALGVVGGGIVAIQTCSSLELLREAYFGFSDYAKQRGLSMPVPVEAVEGNCRNGKVKVLGDMIKDYTSSRDPTRN
jgi:hypothetical protein